MFIDVKNITKSFNEKMILDNISFNLEEHKLLCILGASGSGKSTLLNILGGFLYPDSGQIIINNEDVTKLPAEDRPTSTVFQSYGLFPNMTVFENITYGLKIKKINKKQIEEIGNKYLELVSLTELKNQNVEKISGGQKQRCAVARALIVEPKLCLLDEPFSNLDLNLRVKLRKEIKQIQKKVGTTMIFVTHDIEEAISISDKIIILHDKKIVAEGDASYIFRNLDNNVYVKEFIEASNWKIDENNQFYKVLKN